MAVYLDDSRKPQGCYVLSMLLADTDKELHAIAERVGAWIEEEPDLRGYVSPGLAVRAVRFGKAIEITADQARAMRWHRHHYTTLGTPAGALERFNRESKQKGTP
jgi:hypothetical protein